MFYAKSKQCQVKEVRQPCNNPKTCPWAQQQTAKSTHLCIRHACHSVLTQFTTISSSRSYHSSFFNSPSFTPVLYIKSQKFMCYKVTRLRICVWSNKYGIKGKFWNWTGNSWKQISGSRTFKNMKVIFRFSCNNGTDYLDHISSM